MRMCQPHWERLRDAIRERGMYEFVASSGKEAASEMVAQLDGTEDPETPFDPLMSAHWGITNQVLDRAGLYVMFPKEDGSERCPLCEVAEHGGKPDEWINGESDAILQHFREKGWLPARGGEGQ